MLKQRVVTAVILAAIFLAVLFGLPTPWFGLVLAAVVAVAGWEWANLSGLLVNWQRWCYAAVVAAACWLVWQSSLQAGALDSRLIQPILSAACVWWALALLWVQGYPSSALLWDRRWLKLVMGLVVMVPAWLALVYLHTLLNGAWLVFLLMAVVACADICAYFSGKAFGRRKLAPNVSPGKSWEGFVGGVCGCVILALGVGFLVDDVVGTLVLIVPACVVSVLGDLNESMLKRQRGIKDSSQLLPGHGGILDRIDGVTAAAPVFVLALIMTQWLQG